MEGFGIKTGVKTVLMSCSGGTITAAAHSVLLSAPTHQFSGVTWSDKGACGSGRSTCLISICGDSSATFMSAKVLAVNMTAPAGNAVCLGDRSNITFEHALFQGNVGRSLAVGHEGVYLRVTRSSFVNNSALGANVIGGVLYVWNGTVFVEKSTFSGNSAVFTGGAGGAIGTEGTTRMTITSSTLDGNQGQYLSVQHLQWLLVGTSALSCCCCSQLAATALVAMKWPMGNAFPHTGAA
jgi:hypothetical protein